MEASSAAPPAGAGETPQRLCPRCSALSQTEGDFCPHCGGSFMKRRRRLGRWARLVLVLVSLLALAGGGGGALLVKHNRDAARARAAAAVSARAAAKRAETAAELAQRHTAEREMQTSISKWARAKVADGVLDGPILRTSCTPVGGGSENLAEVTVKYDCLAITTDHSDGSSSGYAVHATMDFSTGSYQWGLGSD